MSAARPYDPRAASYSATSSFGSDSFNPFPSLQSSPLLRPLLEAWPDPVALIEYSTFKVLFANRRLLELCDLAYEERGVLGLEDLIIETQVDRLKAQLRYPHAEETYNPVVYQLRNASVGHRPVELTATCLENLQDTPYLLALRPVMNRSLDQGDSTVLTAITTESARLRALADLAGGVAHNFNNILMTVMGYANLGAMRCTQQPEILQYFAKIEQATLRASELTRQFVELTGQGAIEAKTFDINELLYEAEAFWKAKEPECNFLSFYGCKELPLLTIDRPRLLRALHQVIQNAFESLENSRGTIKVSLQFSANCDSERFRGFISPYPLLCACTVLEVEDTGKGIPECLLARTLEPFYTTKLIGRGLGLSIARGIVHSHGGALQIISEHGKGTKVRFYLPTEKTGSEKKILRSY